VFVPRQKINRRTNDGVVIIRLFLDVSINVNLDRVRSHVFIAIVRLFIENFEQHEM